MGPFVWALALIGSLAEAREVQTLALGSSIRTQIGQQSAVLYQIVIPAETSSISLQLSGCPADARAKNADGTANERVKAYASFSVAKPTVWDATWAIAWCEPRALIVKRGQPGFPAPAGDESATTLYVSVFAAMQAHFTLTVLDPSAKRELKLGRSHSLTLHSSNTFEQATGRRYSVDSPGRPSAMAAEAARGFGETGVVMDTLSVVIPATTAAVAIRVALRTNQLALVSPGSYHTPCKVAALFSFTVANLTTLPASWGFELKADADAVELVIPRTSRAFCKGEPCTLTVQIRDREANFNRDYYSGGYGCNLAPWQTCKCFVVDRDEVGHRLEIGVSEADKSSNGHDSAEHFSKLRARAQTSGSTSTCSPGCEEHLVNDGVCHEACFTSACRHDGGDCSTPYKRTLSGLLSLPHIPLVSSNRDASPQNFLLGQPRSTMELTPYCAAGCPDSWLADGVCQDACFQAKCDWDGPDCAWARVGSVMFPGVAGSTGTAAANAASNDGRDHGTMTVLA